MNKFSKVIIYCRVSSKTQSSGVSLDLQLEKCKSILNNFNVKNLQIVQEVISGYNTFPKTLDNLSNNKNSLFLFYSVDRFCRNKDNAKYLIDKFLKNKCSMIFLRENIKINNNELDNIEKLKEYVNMAEYESNMISDRVKNSITYLRNNGFMYNNKVPFGYKIKENSKNEEKEEFIPRKRIKLDEEDIEIDIINLINSCRTPNTTVTTLNNFLKKITNNNIKEEFWIEYNDEPINNIKYEISYKDISDILNINKIYKRGEMWTPEKVRRIYISNKDKNIENISNKNIENIENKLKTMII